MAGYSTSPLCKKLGLKEGQTVRFFNSPEGYSNLIGEMFDTLLPDTGVAGTLDFVQLFTNNLAELQTALPQLKVAIRKSGMIWVSWYKKSAKRKTELTENIIRDLALDTGLVDVKVCAIDEEWSGLKLVFRLSDR